MMGITKNTHSKHLWDRRGAMERSRSCFQDMRMFSTPYYKDTLEKEPVTNSRLGDGSSREGASDSVAQSSEQQQQQRW